MVAIGCCERSGDAERVFFFLRLFFLRSLSCGSSSFDCLDLVTDRMASSSSSSAEPSSSSSSSSSSSTSTTAPAPTQVIVERVSKLHHRGDAEKTKSSSQLASTLFSLPATVLTGCAGSGCVGDANRAKACEPAAQVNFIPYARLFVGSVVLVASRHDFFFSSLLYPAGCSRSSRR